MNRNNKKALKEEKRNLEGVLNIISSAKRGLQNEMEEIGAFNLEKLKELREDPMGNSEDFLQFIQLLEDKNISLNIEEKYKKLEELEYLQKEPYFSRIDLENAKNSLVKKYYIGRFGHTEDDPIIIDWRAKVASVYYRYRYPQNDVKYITEEGEKTRNLLLKRTFEISNGELVKYYNNDIQLDEDELLVEKVGKRTGGVLEDIIQTIQADQHDIIEADPRKVCIVQGAVGSGKSSVAIHKLSYMFFNFPNLIRPEKSILIAKNQVLAGYLSTLFPKLGIFDINYGTLRELVYGLLFKEGIDVKFDLGKNTDLSTFTLEELKKMKMEVNKIHSRYEKLIEKVFNKPEFENFGGYLYERGDPVLTNITEIIEDLNEEIRIQKELLRKNPDGPYSKRQKENVKTLRKIIKKLNSLSSNLKKKTLKKLSKKFTADKEPFGYLEVLKYIIIYTELIGLNKFGRFEYCVVDEGQDFSIIEYYILGKLVRNCRFCILGDLNQSYLKEGINSWSEIKAVIEGADEAEIFSLEKNYRSTKSIVEFANSLILKYTNKYLPVPIERRGKKPSVVNFDNIPSLIAQLEKGLTRDLKDEKLSVGIICYNQGLYDKVNNMLSGLKVPKHRLVKLKPSTRIDYVPNGIYLTNFESCKGLEFEKVYIVGLNIDKISTFNKAKKAFVAVTRAMNELSVYSYENE